MQCNAKGKQVCAEPVVTVNSLQSNAMQKETKLVKHQCTCSHLKCCLQGGDNFAREFKQLRRSFRFNEYKSISDVNPPRNFVERVSLNLALFACTVHSRCLLALCVIDGCKSVHVRHQSACCLIATVAGITCTSSAET